MVSSTNLGLKKKKQRKQPPALLPVQYLLCSRLKTLHASNCGKNQAFGYELIRRPIASSLPERLDPPVLQRGGTIGWPLLCPAL
jgi:hypothetical protein